MNRNFKPPCFFNPIALLTVVALTAVLVFNACQKDDLPSIKTGSLTDHFNPQQKRFESIFNINQDIKFFLHHYSNGDVFKLINGYDKEKHKNLKLFINDEEILFTENRYALKGKEAKFLKDLYGKNNKITYVYNDHEKLEYHFKFPELLDFEPYIGTITPNKTTLSWNTDKEAKLGIAVSYLEKISEGVYNNIFNYDIIRNSGEYTIPDKLFDDIPNGSKVHIKLIQGTYLTDTENSVKLLVFSMKYMTAAYVKNK